MRINIPSRDFSMSCSPQCPLRGIPPMGVSLGSPLCSPASFDPGVSELPQISRSGNFQVLVPQKVMLTFPCTHWSIDSTALGRAHL